MDGTTKIFKIFVVLASTGVRQYDVFFIILVFAVLADRRNVVRRRESLELFFFLFFGSFPPSATVTAVTYDVNNIASKIILQLRALR